MGAEALTPTTSSGAASGAVVVGVVRCAHRREGDGDKLTEERAEGGRREREREQLARLQSKIRWAIRWGCAGGREGRKVTRAQTPTKSIEDSTRHRSGVPDRASSSVTVCSSWQRIRSLSRAHEPRSPASPPKTESKSNAQSSANATTVVVTGRERSTSTGRVEPLLEFASYRLINEAPLSRAPATRFDSHLLTEPSRSSSLFEVFR